ncbi:MAG: hypothetical protein Kow00114_19860 [Kiloniellaceae bacterium]
MGNTQGPHPEEARSAVSKDEDRGAAEGSHLSAFVYMLRCADGRFYVGSTRKGLEERLAEHNAGIPGSYTASRRPVALAWSQDFASIADAVAVERRIKGWNRAKKKALIAGDFDTIRRLASRKKG